MKKITRCLSLWLIVLSLGCGKFLPTPIPPGPQPNPRPIHAPITSGLWFVIVEESAATSTQFAELKNDLAFWSDLNSRGIRHFIYDDDLPETLEGSRPADADRIRKYVDAVKGIDRPALLVIKPDGSTVLRKQCPTDREGMEQVAKSLGK